MEVNRFIKELEGREADWLRFKLFL
jgi:hypothetical protein